MDFSEKNTETAKAKKECPECGEILTMIENEGKLEYPPHSPPNSSIFAVRPCGILRYQGLGMNV
jgi:hypothetical protein